ALVELVDIAPTLLDILGMDIPYYMQGQSLLPILSGEADPDYHKDSVYCEYYYALETHKGVYAAKHYDDRYKLVVYDGDDPQALYDLKNDRNELDNLWSSPEYEELKAKLVLDRLNRSVRMSDPKPNIVGYH